MKVLFTGSRVYGTPHKNSDLDMVVLVDTQDDLLAIREMADTGKRADGKNGSGSSANDTSILFGSYRFGALNLIVCATEWQFVIWARGTAQLLAEKAATGPVTRERAVEVFTQLKDAGKP